MVPGHTPPVSPVSEGSDPEELDNFWDPPDEQQILWPAKLDVENPDPFEQQWRRTSG